MNDVVCKSEDDFISDKCKFVVELSNGEIVFQDDDREGLDPPQSWYRLKKYVETNDLQIKKLWLQFRGHEERSLPENAHGYYYSKYLICNWYGWHAHCCTIGYWDKNNDKIYKEVWKVPELIKIDTLEQFAHEDRLDALIKNV